VHAAASRRGAGSPPTSPDPVAPAQPGWLLLFLAAHALMDTVPMSTWAIHRRSPDSAALRCRHYRLISETSAAQIGGFQEAQAGHHRNHVAWFRPSLLLDSAACRQIPSGSDDDCPRSSGRGDQGLMLGYRRQSSTCTFLALAPTVGAPARASLSDVPLSTYSAPVTERSGTHGLPPNRVLRMLSAAAGVRKCAEGR
jgi:hypothetical protein